ncbi:MAG: BON domain-containing protein [Candidatus Odinarchaeota archaeon]
MEKLEKIIKDRLTWDNTIDESQIAVSVENGIAILKGCVSTYPEKVLAEIETQMVPGIESVVNEIAVKFPESYETPSDENVREAMICLLDANSEIASNDVQVTVNKGDVILEGVVDTYWKREKIRKMASQITGVLSISNKIAIIPKEKISDEDIAKNVMISMQNSVHIDAHKVDVKVEGGNVILSGTLSSMSEYDAVKEIVELTKGVIDIKNNLKWILQYHTT